MKFKKVLLTSIFSLLTNMAGLGAPASAQAYDFYGGPEQEFRSFVCRSVKLDGNTLKADDFVETLKSRFGKHFQTSEGQLDERSLLNAFINVQCSFSTETENLNNVFWVMGVATFLPAKLHMQFYKYFIENDYIDLMEKVISQKGVFVGQWQEPQNLVEAGVEAYQIWHNHPEAEQTRVSSICVAIKKACAFPFRSNVKDRFSLSFKEYLAPYCLKKHAPVQLEGCDYAIE